MLAFAAFAMKRGTLVAATAAVVLGGIALGVWFFTAHNAMEVFLDGESAGFIAELDTTAEDITTQLENAISVTVGSIVRIDQEITLEPARASAPDEVRARHEIIPYLRGIVTYTAEGFVIYVGGVAHGTLRNREAAESVLSGLVQRRLADNAQLIGQPDFAEDVSIQSRFVDESLFDSTEATIARLAQEHPVSGTYTVQPGDSMSIIASRVGMTLEALFNANPDVSPANPGLSIGQTINVVYMTPLLSVRTVELSVITEDEPYGSEIISNPMQPATYRSVVQPGRVGVREVTSHVTRVNGLVTDTEVISERVLQEPLNETVVVGTRGS